MNIRTSGASALAGIASFVLCFGIANADTTLSVTCSGAPSASSVVWTASAQGGVAPLALLWGNGSTSTSQTLPYAAGTYSMTIQATDASSSIATSTCSATVEATSTPTTSIQDQIQSLLNEIASLKAQLELLVRNQLGGAGTTTPPTTPPGQVDKAACISLNRNLSEGDSGDDVLGLQQMLASDPTYGFTASTTGYFGPATARAVMRFQEDRGIASSSTGYVGPMTRGYFERECGDGLVNSSDRSQAPEATSSSSGDNSGIGASASSTPGNSDNGNGNSGGPGDNGSSNANHGHGYN